MQTPAINITAYQNRRNDTSTIKTMFRIACLFLEKIGLRACGGEAHSTHKS
jgi:hypothetical protein